MTIQKAKKFKEEGWWRPGEKKDYEHLEKENVRKEEGRRNKCGKWIIEIKKIGKPDKTNEVISIRIRDVESIGNLWCKSSFELNQRSNSEDTGACTLHKW